MRERARRRRTGRGWLWLIRAVLALGAAAAAWASSAATFAQRLDLLDVAVRKHLEAMPGDAARFPNELMRVAWVQFEGDTLPDALLVLKQQRSDCAAASRGPKPCRVLLLIASAGGGYSVASEFTLREGAIVLQRSSQGAVQALYLSADSSSDPTYRRYVLREGRLQPDGAALPWTQLARLRSLVIDDRSLPVLADQRYAAENFDNSRAKMAPFRLHIDGINTTGLNSLVVDALFDERAQFVAHALTQDAARLTGAIGWVQTLDLRLWSCDDWMVLRRFWEVEEFRLGRIGICIEPVVFALRQGLVQSTQELAALARWRLLGEVGTAFVLRSMASTAEEREALKAPAARERLVFMGTAAGALIGVQLGLQTPEAALNGLTRWRSVSDRWFTAFERDMRDFVIKSPELRAFDNDLDQAERALRCVMRVVQPARASGCAGASLEAVDRIKAALASASSS